MSRSSGEESDRSYSKLEDYSDTCYKQLKDGKFEVRISAEVYRCPYCSQKKRKQQYGFEDLLKHACAIVEGSGLKGGVKKGEHIGLIKYLESLERSKPLEKISLKVLNHSQNSDDNELLVYPWVGIVANIPVTFQEGKHFGESTENLTSEFTAKGFNPVKVTRLWNYRSHICFAVVEFGEGWQGFHSAMKFEKCFEASGNDKKKFFDARHLGSELYGWIGREDDYYSEMAFGEFLRKFTDLKTIKEIEAEEKNKSDILLSSLSTVTEEENTRLKDIKLKFKETSMLLNNLITQKDNLFQAYNQGILHS